MKLPPPTLADCTRLLEARRRALCEEINAAARLAPFARAEARIAHPRDD